MLGGCRWVCNLKCGCLPLHIVLSFGYIKGEYNTMAPTPDRRQTDRTAVVMEGGKRSDQFYLRSSGKTSKGDICSEIEG